MKETPLTQAFEDAMRKIDSDPAHHHIAQQLAMIQHAVIDFRDAGVDMTLTVRSQARGCAIELEENTVALANGEIISGDIRLDFFIEKEGYYRDTMSLKIYRDEELVLERKSTFDEENKTWSEVAPEHDEEDSDGGYDDEDEENIDWSEDSEDEDNDDESKPAVQGVLPPPDDLKSAVTRLIIDIKAQQDFAAQFNVGPNGVAGSSVEKPFPVAPPLKLKKPDGP